MNIKQLRQMAADNEASASKLKAEGRALLAKAGRSAEETTRLDAIDGELATMASARAGIDADMARAERYAEEQVSQSALHPVRESAGGVKTTGRWEGHDAEERLAVGATPTVYRALPAMKGHEALAYAFGQQLVDVFHATTRHQMSQNLATLQAAAQGAGEKIGSDGGFAVQTDVASGLMERVFEGGALLNAVRQIPLSANANGVTLNAVIDERSRATGSRWGGVNAYWVDEGTAPTASRPKFRKLDLKLNKLAALGYATDELLADFVALGSVMFQAFTEEVRFLVENAILSGTGAGQPLGVLNADAKVAVTRTTSSRIKHADVINMWARMHSRSKRNAIWLCNTDVNPDLDQLFLTPATNDLPVRFVTYGDDGVMRIKGKPVVETEYNATLGTEGDFMLVDMTQYLFIQKLLQTASSMHVAFATDEQAFRVTWRVDGKPAWVAALTPFKGSATLSPFITVAA
jgi:HK97 family phage major capsid protein